MDEVGERMDGYGDFASGILQRPQFINPLPVFANAMRKSEAAIFVQLESKFRFEVG